MTKIKTPNAISLEREVVLAQLLKTIEEGFAWVLCHVGQKLDFKGLYEEN